MLLDGDLPEYDDLDRLSVPNFSDTESIVSGVSSGVLSQTLLHTSLSARDLQQLERDADTTSLSGISIGGGMGVPMSVLVSFIYLDNSIDFLRILPPYALSLPGLGIPRATSMNNMMELLTISQQSSRPEVGVRRARMRQNSVC